MNYLWLKIKKNYGKFLAGSFLGVIFLLGTIHIYNKPHRLEINFFDVGQGDASLIKTPSNRFILIDGGPDNRILRRLGDNLPFYRRRIDYLILSHYHEDHVVGLVEILKRYQVKNFIYAPSALESPAFVELLDAAQKSSVAVLALKNTARISYGDNCYLNLLNPAILEIKADDNNSLIAKLDCRDKKVLFSGDNSSTVEKILLNTGWDVSADVFKASHHGSKSANSETFLSTVNPKLIVISVGADNRFGHPSVEIIDRIESLDIRVERTDKMGNIQIFSEL